MAQTREELVVKLTETEQAQKALIENLTILITEMTNAFTRFLAKLAAGNDYQAEVDKLTVINQALVDAKAKVDSAISQSQSQGL